MPAKADNRENLLVVQPVKYINEDMGTVLSLLSASHVYSFDGTMGPLGHREGLYCFTY